jgi:hypothetical protein
MRNKFVRLAVTDKNIKTGLVFLVLTACLFPVLWRQNKTQQKELRLLKEKKEFAAQLPQLKEKQRILEEQGKIIEEPLPDVKDRLAVTGIFIAKKGNTALINGELYRVGDPIENFVVSNIALTSVTLRDTIDGKIIRLLYQDIPANPGQKLHIQNANPTPVNKSKQSSFSVF